MKKYFGILLLITVILTGCAAGIQNTPTPVATLNLDAIQPTGAQPTGSTPQVTGGVTASGVVKAAQEAKIGSQIAGNLASVGVKLGDVVQDGQVLAVFCRWGTGASCLIERRKDADRGEQPT